MPAEGFRRATSQFEAGPALPLATERAAIRVVMCTIRFVSRLHWLELPTFPELSVAAVLRSDSVIFSLTFLRYQAREFIEESSSFALCLAVTKIS